ncbi:MAG: ABC transporter permease subunit, partial [Clostridiaceae bacterium]|nr:ABC transporter permease subunit [Clostridiaceae bacterium]
NLTIFFKIIIPGALSSILTGMRTGMTMSFMMLIGAETLGADSGLGWLIHNAKSMGFIPRIYLAAILIAVLGLGVNYIFQWLEENIIIWKEVTHDKAI